MVIISQRRRATGPVQKEIEWWLKSRSPLPGGFLSLSFALLFQNVALGFSAAFPRDETSHPLQAVDREPNIVFETSF